MVSSFINGLIAYCSSPYSLVHICFTESDSVFSQMDDSDLDGHYTPESDAESSQSERMMTEEEDDAMEGIARPRRKFISSL